MWKRRRSRDAEHSGVPDPATGRDLGRHSGPEGDSGSDSDAVGEARRDPRAEGPWDVSEIAVDDDEPGRANLGALSIRGAEGLELRLQVDEESQQVLAVLLVASDGAMELRAFAAPRHEDLWEELRPTMRDEAVRRGGRARESEGPYGPALHMAVPAVTPQGEQVLQPSTVHGISGPRWLLRVMMFGRPATDFRPDGPLETALRSVVVRRGSEPMAPGDPLPLALPTNARRLGPPARDSSRDSAGSPTDPTG